jgi:hypothetical protein
VSSVWLTLTRWSVFEGGRERHPLALYFPLLTDAESDFFGDDPVVVRTEDGFYLVGLASGHWGRARPDRSEEARKNLRSKPDRAFGEWLVERRGLAKEALVGRTVQFTDGGRGCIDARLMPEGWAR